MFENTNTTEAFGITAVEAHYEPVAPENGSILIDDDLSFIGYTFPQLREMAREDCLMGREPLYPRSEVYMAKYIELCTQGKMGAYLAPVDESEMLHWAEDVNVAEECDLF